MSLVLLLGLLFGVCYSQTCEKVDIDWALKIPYITIESLRSSYDFIVIGGGTSGSVLSVRLATHESHPSVLLLEAGAKANISSSSPEMVPPHSFLTQQTSVDWEYQTIPQKHCCEGLINRRSQWPRGKVCGGSSVLNTMFWIWGHPQDWDTIMQGKLSKEQFDGWTSADVIPFYKKVENFHSYPYDINAINEHRGNNGPIEINDVRNLLHSDITLTNDFIDACIVAGNAFIEDVNDWQLNGNNVGCHFAQNNIEYKSGLRNNAFVGYMKYLSKHSSNVNLDILPMAHVTKILFDQEMQSDVQNMKIAATAVEFVDLKSKKKHSISLSSMGEIILSAGTINSPQILMLSGFGPRQHLIEHKIPVIADLMGVGQNLQDHIFVMSRYHLKDEYSDQTVNENTIHKNMRTSALEANAFIITDVGKQKYGEDMQWPDVKLHWIRAGYLPASYFNMVENAPDMDLAHCGTVEEKELFFKDLDNVQCFFIEAVIEHPESRGEITLASDDPFEYPNIDPKYLSAENDIQVLKEGWRLLMDMMDAESKLRLKWDKRLKCLEFGDIDNDDKALEAFLRASILTQYHPIGTCKMGNIEEDESAVVDNKLRLKYTTNVRIVDASVLPRLVSGNPQATCYMLGERGAAFIIDDWIAKTEENSI